MRLLESLYTTLLGQPFPDAPEMVYAVRLMSAMSVAVGVFYVLLALRPMDYGVLVPFSLWPLRSSRPSRRTGLVLHYSSIDG